MTSLSPAIVVFTLYEGLVCASLRTRRGVWPAAVAQGVAIFVLASGVF